MAVFAAGAAAVEVVPVAGSVDGDSGAAGDWKRGGTIGDAREEGAATASFDATP